MLDAAGDEVDVPGADFDAIRSRARHAAAADHVVDHLAVFAAVFLA
jgi:hypothetical protein